MATVDIFNLADTWNNGATTFNGIMMDFSDGAAGNPVGASASRTINMKKNGTSVFSVDVDGGAYVNSLSFSGNISAAAWTTNGIRIKGVAATLTDTSSSGTVAAAYTNVLGGNTIAASSATTFSDYFTTFLTAASAGTNVTLTRSWALGLSGNLKVTGTALLTSLLTITQASANTGILASTGYSLTGSNATSMIDLAGTLNTTGSPDVFALRITDTARGASTKFFNIYGGASGTTSMFAIDRLGQVTVPAGSAYTVPQYNLGASSTGLGLHSTVTFSLVSNSTGVLSGHFSTGLLIKATLPLGWSNAEINGSADVQLYRDAAAILALRVSTAGLTFRQYATYTNSSNGAWAFQDAAVTTAATYTIGTSGNGTGASTLDKIQISLLGTVRADYGVTAASTWTFSGTVSAGALKVGTHSAIAAETVTGYITIKDSAGTDRKIAVVS